RDHLRTTRVNLCCGRPLSVSPHFPLARPRSRCCEPSRGRGGTLDTDGGIRLNAEGSVRIREQQCTLAHPPGGKHSDERQCDAIQLLIKTVCAIDDTSRFIENPCLTLSQSGLLDTLPCH